MTFGFDSPCVHRTGEQFCDGRVRSPLGPWKRRGIRGECRKRGKKHGKLMIFDCKKMGMMDKNDEKLRKIRKIGRKTRKNRGNMRKIGRKTWKNRGKMKKKLGGKRGKTG